MPYLELPTLGPINSFGVFAILGVFFGSSVAYRHAERLGLDMKLVRRMVLVCALSGLVGAHLVDVFLYQPGWSQQSDAASTLLNPFAGISSFGGIIGVAIGFFCFAHFSGIRRSRYSDSAALGLLVLLTFGRAGCASVHDHVGVASNSALAVDFPASSAAGVVGPHFDLGLLELLFLLVLLTSVVLWVRRPRRSGLLAAVILIGYSIPRFFLEFLRREVSDPRYASLTPAQWSSIAALVTGVALLGWILLRRTPHAPPDYLPATSWRRYILFRSG